MPKQKTKKRGPAKSASSMMFTSGVLSGFRAASDFF